MPHRDDQKRVGNEWRRKGLAQQREATEMIGDALQRGTRISRGNAVIRNGMDRYSQDAQWNRPASHCNGIDEQGIAVNCNGKGMNCIGNDPSSNDVRRQGAV